MDTTLLEILGNLITQLEAAERFPTEEKINENLKRLRNEQWFRPLFSEHTQLFLEHRDIRLIVGFAKLDKILNNERKQKDFQETLLYLLKRKSPR
ncbi:hypothetical protein CON65_16235 [Bacillus pseudomycoides]|uniref:Uncharacterized protein n=1 Tax=Bacillus pseudomycoides TaxID=64104 RepID=A0AA91VAW4_9BACI|nr:MULTISPECIES: hypothetical protein [Bacillus]PEB48531.1 hypothetical protein COO03_24320 [Bacillus sp. AFS098217]PED81621.1 hypothetical protein CON65_16235 [Bacillus pseudomycoides]PEU07674.1 hypothetical protein CN524_19970 [Bacillus sp. AFS019443]PEU16961.1 hypothetical protein CN525_15365 [Bacillus sp. AFS014408]PFW61421.1 hypothetical protein COL20_17620 [Bacillus sp. AFS075034]